MTMARQLRQSGGSPAESTAAAATERGCVGGGALRARLGTRQRPEGNEIATQKEGGCEN